MLADTSRIDVQYRRAEYIEVDAGIRHLVEQKLEDARKLLAADSGSLGRREGVGFLRYRAGGFYKPHRDRGRVPSWPGAARRRLSVLLFLNSEGEDFEGGQLRLFEPERRDIIPVAGALVAFPSAWLHEVTPVQSGIRDVIVDWFYDPVHER